ncbi:MAG: type II toxin-antitoxin system VapC family toxin [Deltaproteobacteria bacterium]|nr:type II toxin-antitoxin system VapC family toxin [Deltaproteobacteria bacterium]
MIQIIDASVAVKWFAAEEHFKAEALEILDKIKDSPREFAVPELFFNEMLSVLCRLLHDPLQIQGFMNDLQDLGFARLGNGRETLSQATLLAKKFNLSGYDAIYAANAKLTQGVWITADGEAHKKIVGLRLSRYLGD